MQIRTFRSKCHRGNLSRNFAVSRNLEMPQTIAYLGPEGTYTHQAARSRFGAMSRYIALANIEDVFKELSNKEAKYGVVPIENNTEGAVGITLDCLGKYNELKILVNLYGYSSFFCGN